ncbi:MAG TPA: sulfatase-like hydrolase/transferase [Planctomycetota bacterium]|nr:sulfatase-like hydrolase/transferase [Planctomycetota bacterium]
MTAASETELSSASGTNVPARKPDRLRAMLYVALANVALACWIGTFYLDALPTRPDARLWLFAHAGLVSSMLTLVLVPASGLALAALSRISDRAFLVLQCVTWSLFHITLTIDTRVFGLYHYHLNGAAWNLLTTRGSQDSYHLGPRIWALGTAMFLVLCAGQWLVWRLAWQRTLRTKTPSTLRPTLVWIFLFSLSIGVEKTIYADADLSRDREVVAVAQLFPIYTRLRVSELWPRDENAEPSPPDVAVRYEGARLAVAPAELRLPADGPRPNILVLVVDSWRQDMLDPEVTPKLWAFAQTARRFDDHLSGGNATRFGLFSLLYGLHGSYWWPVLDEQRPPLLVTALQQAGWQPRVFSSASMEFPELRRTAWASIEANVEDHFPSPRRAERDALLGRRFAAWLPDALAARQPFFAFALLDAAHQTYDFPEDQAPFQPCAEELDYLEMARTHDGLLREQVRNRYKNALHYVDSVAGSMLEALEQSGALDDTIVLITGDHGEEFAEHGHWGHTSNFAPEQVRVPLLLRGPGIAPGVESRPTSHVDVAATLLEACGLPAARRAAWTFGENLLAPPERRDRVVAGWGELGLWTDDAILRVPMAADCPLELVAYGADWRLLPEQDRVIARHAPALVELSRACGRFLDLGGALPARGSQ